MSSVILVPGYTTPSGAPAFAGLSHAKAKFKATAKKCGKVHGKGAKKACWRAAYKK